MMLRKHRLCLALAAMASLHASCNVPETVRPESDPPEEPSSRPGPKKEPGDDPAARALAALEHQGARERGKELFRYACATCHGLRGDGTGPSAGALDPRPRDFTRGLYKWRSTESGSLPRDGDIYRTISRGVPGTLMPAWVKLLSEEERWDLVEYLKSFSARFAEEPVQPEEIIQIPGPSPITEETISRGKKAFEDNKCWECHGREGRGNGPASATLRDTWEKPIKPFDFTHGQYRCGGTDRDIYRTFYTGLNGTPMPSYALTIPEPDRWPLVHFVRSLQRKPSFLESLLFESP